jgi:hypothetical protein
MLAPSVEPRSARGCGEESSHFQVAFGRLLPCLGDQSAVWAVCPSVLSRSLQDLA